MGDAGTMCEESPYGPPVDGMLEDPDVKGLDEYGVDPGDDGDPKADTPLPYP
ncbi:hypothetical protein GCM10023159_30130 [Brevibacterium yomogidense]